MPFVYGSVRVSHVESAKSGLSPEAQKGAILARWEYEQRKNPEGVAQHTWGRVGYEGTRKKGFDTTDGFFVDLAVSAFKRPLFTRAAGSRLDRVLERGDIVIFAHLDRAVRSIDDFCTITKRWTKRGVRIIFCSPDVDLSHPYGKAFAQNAAIWAELDSGLKSLKNREIAAYLRSRGRLAGKHVPLGFRRDPRNRKHYLPDNECRRIVRRIVELNDSGLACQEISDILEREAAERENRPMHPKYPPTRREWHPARVTHAAYRFRKGTIPPPTDEPLSPEYLARTQAAAAAAGPVPIVDDD